MIPILRVFLSEGVLVKFSSVSRAIPVRGVDDHNTPCFLIGRCSREVDVVNMFSVCRNYLGC